MRLTLLAALLLPLIVFSQKKESLPAFGKIDKQELISNSCEFDKDAGAMVLFENARRKFDFYGDRPNSELRRHVRMKILSDKGRDYADIHVFYNHANHESIVDIDAQAYNLDEAGNIVVTKVEKSSVYYKKINNRVSEVVFTFPNIKAGTVVEYRYLHRGFYRKDWMLQKAIPVKYTRYEVDFPVMFEVHTMPHCVLPFSSVDQSTSLRTVKVFSMENIPGLRDESYMTSDDDYLQRVESWVTAYYVGGRRYPLTKTWPEIAKLLLDDEDLGLQLKKNISRTQDLDLMLQGVQDPFRRMSIIHKYVAKNMTWDGIDNFWAASGVKTAWKDKVGTSGEINLILINLLRDAGLDARPVMVSTRENGRITTFYPDASQFNKVLAYVTIGDKKYVLDGTDKLTPSHIIPYDVMYSEGLLLDEKNPNKFEWVELWDGLRLEKNTVFYQAKIDAEGKIAGHATVSSADYARLKRIKALSDQKKYIELFLQPEKFSLQVDSFKVKNQDADTLPLVQDFDFTGALNSSGEYSFINLNMFSGMANNPFIADTRFSDVFFGTNQSHTIVSSVRIPEGYTFEEVPKNMRMVLEDQSLVVTRMMQVTGTMLNAKISIEFKKPFYAPDEYDDLKEFYKKMYSMLDEQIVFKKNSVASN